MVYILNLNRNIGSIDAPDDLGGHRRRADDRVLVIGRDTVLDASRLKWTEPRPGRGAIVFRVPPGPIERDPRFFRSIINW